jgi:hypothetical protein
MAGGGTCLCGCGQETRGGRFLPGHDQKLRAAIEQRAGGLEEVRRIVEEALGERIDVKE